eukprot:126580_1
MKHILLLICYLWIIEAHNDEQHICKYTCNILIMDLNEFSQLNTSAKNQLYTKPFIINTILSDWTVPSFWSIENLQSKYGSHIFQMGTSEQLVISGGKTIMNDTLNNYINNKLSIHNNDIYIFDRTIWDRILTENINSTLFNISLWQRHNNNTNYTNIIQNGFLFMLAINSKHSQKQTGTAFHRHDTVYSVTFTGRKRWFLYPPYITPIGGYLPGYSSYDWYNNLYQYLNKTIDNDYSINYIGNKQIN